jgi:hypothetical protein
MRVPTRAWIGQESHCSKQGFPASNKWLRIQRLPRIARRRVGTALVAVWQIQGGEYLASQFATVCGMGGGLGRQKRRHTLMLWEHKLEISFGQET